MLSGWGWNDGLCRDARSCVRRRNCRRRGAVRSCARLPGRRRSGRERPRSSARKSPSARPPELVGVRVDDPVRTELRRREARHPRHPLRLAQILARLADQMQVTVLLVPLEDLRRAVLRAVVGGDDVVDPRVAGGTRSALPMSASSRTSSVITSFTARPPSGQAIRSSAHASPQWTAAEAARSCRAAAAASGSASHSAPLRDAVASGLPQATGTGVARSEARGVRLLAVQRQPLAREPRVQEVVEPRVVGVGEGGAGDEHDAAPSTGSCAAPDRRVVAMSLEVVLPYGSHRGETPRVPHAAASSRGEREPPRLRWRAGATIPALRGAVEAGSSASTVSSSTSRPDRTQPSHGRAEREHSVVGVRDTTTIRDSGPRRPMIAALTGWRRFVPAGVRRRLVPLRKAAVDWRRSRPPRLGALRRVTPIDPNWGFERGTPIDRVYVERFLGAFAS